MAIMYKNRLLCIITNYVNEPWHIHIYFIRVKSDNYCYYPLLCPKVDDAARFFRFLPPSRSLKYICSLLRTSMFPRTNFHPKSTIFRPSCWRWYFKICMSKLLRNYRKVSANSSIHFVSSKTRLTSSTRRTLQLIRLTRTRWPKSSACSSQIRSAGINICSRGFSR